MNFGKKAIFNCTATGSPIGNIQWLHNGELLPSTGDHSRQMSPMMLVIGPVTRHHRGMYQCIIRNERESAQGSAELKLGGKKNFYFKCVLHEKINLCWKEW